MVPGSFYRLDEFPLTATGKIDRKKLSESTASQTRSLKEYVAPSGSVEILLAEIWQELLKVDRVGIYDNFFVLGGNSLRAIMLTSLVQKKLEVKLPLVEVFKNPTISQLAIYITRTEKSGFIAIDAAEKKEYYVMSSAQKRLFVLQQNDPESITYNMSSLLELNGPLDKAKMESCFHRLVRRHESLRTSFEIIQNIPVQRVHDEVDFGVEYYEASEESEVKNIVERFMQPFDLSRAPLMRVGIIKLGPFRHISMVDIHHIVSDGLSHQLLEKEFNAFYGGDELPPLKLQYKDFAEWHNQRVQLGEIDKQKEYWLKEFNGELPVLKLPLDFPRSSALDDAGGNVEYKVSKVYSEGLRALASSQEVTVFTLFLALYYVFLSRISGQEDIVIGTVVAGRRHADIEPLMGMFVNTLALRNYPGGELSFRDFLSSVNHRTLEAFENQDYQFEELVENLMVNRDSSRNPLFDVLFSYIAREPSAFAKERELKVSPYNYAERSGVKFDLVMGVIEEPEAFSVSFNYRAGLFKRESAQRFLNYFEEILCAVLENKDIRLGEISISHALESVDSNAYEMLEEDDTDF
jgi:hypothetical protein